MSGAGAADRVVQNELQEAISAHASSEQTDEYSDDFESDEDGMLNGIDEELTEGNSGAASTGKSVVVESPLLNDDASQKLADLENEAADDLTLSFHEKKLMKIMVLEGDNVPDDRKDGEECLEGQNEGNDRKNNEVLSAAEEVPCDNSERDDLPVHELHKKRSQEEKQPTAKPRLHKQRNTSASDQDQKTVNTGDLKLEDNDRKSPSVIEQMMTTVYEKTRELENPTADSSDGTVKIAEGQIIIDAMQEISMNGQSEHREAKNASKSSVKKPSETKERVLQNSKASLSDRSPSSVHLKTKVKAVPSATPVLSQCLGALNLLENKCMEKKRTEFDKADSVRAAVFQNWLEKKKLFLMELKRTEKEKAENLRNETEKKEALRREESIACFEAWKEKKAREAKKLSEKKKLEEKTPAEQNKEKTEAAQAFKRWKEKKMEYLREQSRKEKESERIRKEKEEELIAEKRRVSISAVEKWNEKKEEYIKKKKVEKFLERKKQEMQQAKKEEKNEKAMEEYERWLRQPSLKGQLTTAQNPQSQTASPAATENKERREELEKKQKKLQSIHGNEMSPPWRPPGKVTYSGNY